jgi:D-alanyl-D-alanine dipeptidase
MPRIGLVVASLLWSIPACALPPGFVRLSEVAPQIRQDIRYAGWNNFTGRPVPGYGAAECWLRREVAEALARVASDLARGSWRLVVYDCYRPARAGAAFAAWAGEPSDQSRKAEFYPRIEKNRLFALGYIARVSSHSNGTAVDAGAETAGGGPLDFGTPFDLFDPRSATASREVSAEAHANRRRLAAAFAAQGFRNYAREWWHFGFGGGGAAYDVPITAR